MITMYGSTSEAWYFILEKYNIFLYFLLWTLLPLSLIKLFKKFVNKTLCNSPHINLQIMPFFLCISLSAILIRGGTQERPLDWGYAYFSKNNKANSIAQNPIFYLARSYIEMMEEKNYKEKFLAVKNINYLEELYDKLKIENNKNNSSIDLQNNDNLPNIVVIILESFVSENCNFLNPKLNQNITPFLSKLSNKGISFSNCFANGIRSAYGIGSIIGSWPVLPGKPIIAQVESGFPTNPASKSMNVLAELGYYRTFLYGGDSNFDNMKGFLIANNFDHVIDQYHPMIAGINEGTAWGNYDHIMLEHLINIIDSQQDTSFMITFFSTTNHDPFIIPNEYKNKFDKINTGKENFQKAKKTMAYNDLILKEFFDKIKTKEWYKNTIFVITSDHGMIVNRDIPNHPRNGHIPLIIYSHLLNNSRMIDKVVSQVDIMPTLIDLIDKDQYLPKYYGVSGLNEGLGFACRISGQNLQWITKNNLYYEIMNKKQKQSFYFNNIWDNNYVELSNTDSSIIQNCHAYIKNAYYKFKSSK